MVDPRLIWALEVSDQGGLVDVAQTPRLVDQPIRICPRDEVVTTPGWSALPHLHVPGGVEVPHDDDVLYGQCYPSVGPGHHCSLDVDIGVSGITRIQQRLLYLSIQVGATPLDRCGRFERQIDADDGQCRSDDREGDAVDDAIAVGVRLIFHRSTPFRDDE